MESLEMAIFRKAPRICEKCSGRLMYIGEGKYRCRECRGETLDNYGKVRTYLFDNPKANIKEIVQATGVKERDLIEFIRNGELQKAILYNNDEHMLHLIKELGKSVGIYI